MNKSQGTRFGTAILSPLTWYGFAAVLALVALAKVALTGEASNAGSLTLALIGLALWAVGSLLEQRQARARARARDEAALVMGQWGIGTAALRVEHEDATNRALTEGVRIHEEYVAAAAAMGVSPADLQPPSAPEFQAPEFFELPILPVAPDFLDGDLAGYMEAVAVYQADVGLWLEHARSIVTPAIAWDDHEPAARRTPRDLLPDLQEVMLADVARTLDAHLAELRNRSENPRVWDEVGYLMHDLLFLATAEVPDVVMGVDGELMKRPAAEIDQDPTVEPGTALEQWPATGQWVIASDVTKNAADPRWPVRVVDPDTRAIVDVILNKSDAAAVIADPYAGCILAKDLDATPPGVPDGPCDDRR